METVRRKNDQFWTWLGWNNVQADDEPDTTEDIEDNVVEYLAERELNEYNIVGIVLDEGPTTDFVFHTVTKEKKFCRYVAIHPQRLAPGEFVLDRISKYFADPSVQRPIIDGLWAIVRPINVKARSDLARRRVQSN